MVKMQANVSKGMKISKEKRSTMVKAKSKLEKSRVSKRLPTKSMVQDVLKANVTQKKKKGAATSAVTNGSAKKKKSPHVVEAATVDESPSEPSFMARKIKSFSIVDVADIKEAVKNCMLLHQKHDTKGKMFDEEEPIFLQLTSMKIPNCPQRCVRFVLKHPLVVESSEVCLIVTDLRKGRKVDHEPTVEHYENFLRDRGVTRKITVLPMRQLKTEYDTYELRRNLLKLYDFFLVDARISGHVAHRLGKIFHEKRKLPTPIKLQIPDLKRYVDKALAKTSLPIHPHGNSFMLQVGHTQMDASNIVDNVSAVVDQMDLYFPGGMNNVSAINIKTAKGLAIPLYVTLKNPNSVTTPRIKAKRPKAYQSFTGDLSTKMDTEVCIHPSGEIVTKTIIKKKKSNRNKDTSDVELYDDSDDDFDDEEADEEEEKPIRNVKKYKEEQSDSEDEEDEANIEKAEEEYLQEYANDEEEEESPAAAPPAASVEKKTTKKAKNKKVTNKKIDSSAKKLGKKSTDGLDKSQKKEKTKKDVVIRKQIKTIKAAATDDNAKPAKKNKKKTDAVIAAAAVPLKRKQNGANKVQKKKSKKTV